MTQLRREGAADKAIVSNIGAEALRLDRYISNLLDLGSEADDRPVRAGDVTIDLSRRSVLKDDAEVAFDTQGISRCSPSSRNIRDACLTHAHLLRTVWGPAQEKHTDYLRVAIRALRQKLERDPKAPALIINEPAVGYRLAAH